MADEIISAGNFIQDFIKEDIAEGGFYEGKTVSVRLKNSAVYATSEWTIPTRQKRM